MEISRNRKICTLILDKKINISPKYQILVLDKLVIIWYFEFTANSCLCKLEET